MIRTTGACLALLTTLGVLACSETKDANPVIPSMASGGTGGSAPPSASGGASNLPNGGSANGGAGDPGNGGQASGGVNTGGNSAGADNLGGAGGDNAGGASAGGGGTGGSGEQYTEDPGTEGDGDHEVGPDYPTDPDLTDQGNPKGQSFRFDMPFADSNIFKGDDETLSNNNFNDPRRIDVYVPAAYVDGTEAPILVLHDGPGPIDRIRNALDNLTTSEEPERKLPAFIVIAVQNGGADSKGSERGLEYDTMSDRFARFINDEVLPTVLAREDIRAAYPNIAFTDNPWGKATMGCSSGGAAALTMGWFRPDLFRRLITYSGTFVDQQDDDAAEEAEFPGGAWEYHSDLELIETAEKKPLRIFIHASENDNGAGGANERRSWLVANQRMAESLAAKGYNYRFVYSRATGHCDGKVYDLTLADTLVWMWRGYHAE